MSRAKALILASQSPFRRTLLASTGVRFEVRTAPIDEHAITSDDPRTLARLRSEAKALATSREAPEALVIGGDQVLSLDGAMFSKVDTAGAAAERLARLAGHTHYLHTGLAVAFGGALVATEVVDVPMPMRPLGAAEIAAYVATGEWRGSVGCYQFENRGVHLFQGVDADHSAIVGLPLQRLLQILRDLGVDALVQPDPPWTLRVT